MAEPMLQELVPQDILKGGLMENIQSIQSLGAVMEQGGIALTFPAPGVVLGGHIYIPFIPPLPILPVIIT